MKLRRLLLAAVLAVSPIAALAQQSGVGPTPPAGASPPYAPLGGCVYMPNGVALTGYVGPMGLTCGVNGGLNVNVLTGGGGGAADQSGTNASDGQTTSTNNQHTLAFNYGYNGTTWDRVYVNSTLHALLEQTVGPSMNAPGTSGTIARTIQGAVGGVPVPVLPSPQTATGSTSGVTVGTTSAQAAAAQSRKFLALDNESPTATLSCAFGATAAINTAGSFTIPPQNTRTWSGSFVPADAVNCIASAASTPLTLEQN